MGPEPSGADRRLHHPVENVPVETRRSGFALWFDVFSHELIRELGYRGYPALGGLLARRIVTMRHRSQDALGARSGALRCYFPHRSNCVAAHGGAAS